MELKVLRLRGKSPRIQTSPMGFLLFCSSFVVPLLLLSLALPSLAGNSFSSTASGGLEADVKSTDSETITADIFEDKKTSKVEKFPGAATATTVENPSCFCKIDSGLLEDCPCSTDTIKSFNKNIHDKVLEMLKSNYFRYFQVNFYKPCKFWEHGDGQCGSRTCAVDTCPDHEVPADLLNHQEKGHTLPEKEKVEHTLYSYFQEKVHEFLPLVEPLIVSWRGFTKDYLPGAGECEGDPLPAYSQVDTALPAESAAVLNEFCTLDPLEAGESCDYIDLLKNEEKFTGYMGKSANRIWQKIYSDLCFKPKGGVGGEDLCLEERTFYRIVSGLHTSITVHLCRNYLLQEENLMLGKPPVWGPNKQEFHRRFDPALTQNQGPEWLRNVYYLYLVELRALAKAGELLSSLHYGGDTSTQELVRQVVAAAQQFPPSFNESQLFRQEDVTKKELLAQFKEKFREISHMMDCMGCERCKVWGKLQVTGIGTALKILFTPAAELRLTRHEVVALLNGFGRVSTSIQEIDSFRE